MKSLSAVVAAVCITLAGSAFAQDTAAPAATSTPAAAPAPAATPAEPEDQRLVCRSERVTGTRNTKRVCRTPEQARADKEAAQELVKKGQRMTSAESGGG